MNRLQGVLFHKLQGKNGLFDEISNIDVGRVLSINYRKRLFMIFDKKRPYVLEIEYYLPTPYIYNSSTCYISKRYKYEKVVKEEISEIKRGWEYLDKLKKEHSKNFKNM